MGGGLFEVLHVGVVAGIKAKVGQGRIFAQALDRLRVGLVDQYQLFGVGLQKAQNVDQQVGHVGFPAANHKVAFQILQRHQAHFLALVSLHQPAGDGTGDYPGVTYPHKDHAHRQGPTPQARRGNVPVANGGDGDNGKPKAGKKGLEPLVGGSFDQVKQTGGSQDEGDEA